MSLFCVIATFIIAAWIVGSWGLLSPLIKARTQFELLAATSRVSMAPYVGVYGCGFYFALLWPFVSDICAGIIVVYLLPLLVYYFALKKKKLKV